MYYITVKQSPMYHQMTLEDLLFGNPRSQLISKNETNTRTYEVENVSYAFRQKIDAVNLVKILEAFNKQTEELRNKPRYELYNKFPVPKKSGGLRWINAPNEELKDALRRLKTIFEKDFGALYHTSAFAYIKGRCNVDCMRRHQANESKWYAKYDLHDFFGSTTFDFVMNMLSMIFPFSELCSNDYAREQLGTALSLAFLDGGLPQGTPFSPTITNIMMIPVDFKLSNMLRDYNGQKYVYTRYADDFQVTSRYSFSFKEIEKLIVDTLDEFGASFKINTKKTRYGSTSGRNWNLGIMTNANNEITVGHKKKKQFQAMLSSYIMDKQHGVDWDKSDVRTMEGYRSYYRMVEGETIDRIVEHINQKFGVNVVQMIEADLKCA